MYACHGKRFFDVGLALILIIVLSSVFVLILFVYLVKGYPNAIFVQERIGFKEKAFNLFKFRTLKGDESFPLLHRQFRWGTFLRRTSLDELPQIWNVLKGDMSFIGPRPLPTEYLALFSSRQRLRHSVRPGITGWAQVNGRHSLSWAAKFELDVYYVQNISFWFDVKILLKTMVLLIIVKKDISLEEQKFQGNA